MCRNIRHLHNFKPPATKAEIEASALQYVRKLSGMNEPSAQNEEPFNRAVHEITAITQRLFKELVVKSAPHTREEEAERARERGLKREAQLRARYSGG